MKLMLGPVLYWRQPSGPNEWRFSLHLLLDGDSSSKPPVTLQIDDPAGSVSGPEVAADFSKVSRACCTYWRWTIAVPREDGDRTVQYTLQPRQAIDGLEACSRAVSVPGTKSLPRIAFFSCNGGSSAIVRRRLADPIALWRDMAGQHQKRPFQLLLGGGDQIYADSVFDANATLRRFEAMPLEERVAVEPPPELERELIAEYVALYAERWQPYWGIGAMMACVPGLYTWDDHDIFDCWGSHEELQESKVFQTVYRAAALTFQVFQLGQDASGDAHARHFLQTAAIAAEHVSLDVVLLDLRSGRTLDRVMSDEQWSAFAGWLSDHARAKPSPRAARHVLLVSSIPLVYLRFGAMIESAGTAINMRDDLLDQWESGHHSGERDRLLRNLLDHGRRAHTAITVLSGDVHVASCAQVRSTEPRHVPRGRSMAIIDQVTASGIVHAPPPPAQFFGLNAISAQGPMSLGGGVETQLLPVHEQLLLRERNYLAIEFDPPVEDPNPLHKPRMWIHWWAEETVVQRQVVVEPP